MRLLRLTAATLEEAIESVDSPLGSDDPREEVCSEDCDFIKGAGYPPCHCFHGDGDVFGPGQ